MASNGAGVRKRGWNAPVARGGPAAMRIEGRPYTTIERNLVERMVTVVLNDLSAAFAPLSPVTFRFDRLETNPRFATITRPGNAAILISLRLDVDGRGGMLQILFPYATIEPIRELLTQSFMGEKLGRDHVWEGHLATEIWQADVDMEAVLHEVTLPLKRVLNLKVGDTLCFAGSLGLCFFNRLLECVNRLRVIRTTCSIFLCRECGF